LTIAFELRIRLNPGEMPDNQGSRVPIHAIVEYEDPYVQPLLLSAIKSRLPSEICHVVSDASSEILLQENILQFRSYESIDFESALASPSTNLINAYVIRKALIRKHYLSNTISSWLVKNPQSILRTHFKVGVEFEIDYAEFLEDALIEAFELRESFEGNEEREPSAREWWVLKPGMSDRGQGIRLFSTEAELQSIFEGWEEDLPSEDEEEEEEEEEEVATEADAARQTGLDNGSRQSLSAPNVGKEKDYIMTSQLRHFTAQPYIHPPLLLPLSEGRKFHIRTYVLAVGALKAYVYKPMLALFAAEPYSPPWESPDDLKRHLTNTCIQGTDERDGSVRAFWGLEGDVPSLQSEWKQDVWDQICAVTGGTFEAAARGQVVHFQALPNAFELFGLDFLVDANGTAWLLEVNAFPDFRQTGDELRGLVQGLFEDVVDVAIKPFFGIEEGSPQGTERMRKVLDLDLGRR
jgi:tubulin---tyrosine ligase